MEKLEVVRSAAASLEAGRPVELVVLAATRGPSARGAGAWLVVNEEGACAGTVGGSAIETLAIRTARELLAAKRSCLASYDLGGRAGETGAACTTVCDLAYLYFDSDKLEFCKQLEKSLVERIDCELFVDLSRFDGARARGAEPLRGASVSASIDGSPTIRLQAAGTARAEDPEGLLGGGAYVERLCPEGRVYIMGCGHVGRALAPVLARAGFSVVACDNRVEALEGAGLPEGVERRLVDYGDLSGTCAIGVRDLVVCCTSSHGSDYAVVEQALAAVPAYLGCMGSPKKAAHFKEGLARAGASPELVERLHMPVGVPMACETPAEIAISIAAEMIDVRRTVLMPRP